MEAAAAILWFTSIITATIVGAHRDSTIACFLICVFLGPVGLVAVCFIDNRPTCPLCGGTWSRAKVLICPHCQTNIAKMKDDITTTSARKKASTAADTPKVLDAEAEAAIGMLANGTREPDFVDRVRVRR
ncbi:MAG: hypothetical protein AB7O26_03135 [Planctomycetaceae bacterium]